MSIKAENVEKTFGEPPTRVLKNINLKIDDGEFISISGRSGSGKSTLLYILSTLDLPSSGSINIDKKNIAELSVEEMHQFRNLNLGFVFQFHYLLTELTALENVLMPARKLNLIEEKKEEAIDLFKLFNMENKIDKFPGQLSGGEQQRVAIARALIMKPGYLFADEPTGNLDSKNGKIVMDILKRTNKESGTTLVLVTHESEYARMADRIVNIKDGEITKNHTSSSKNILKKHK